MANKPYRSDAGLILMILAFPFWVMWWVAKSIVALVVFIINVIKKKRYEGRAVRIESGKKLIIPVYGEHYAQKKGQSSLMNEMFSDAREFSLTPQCDYQKKQGWPEPPFANVNNYGSLQTEKNNWLGYISPLPPDSRTKEKKERRDYILKLIKITEKTPVTVTGKIIDERETRGSLELILFCSRKSIDEVYEKYVKNSVSPS